MRFKNLLAILLVFSCVDAKQFGTSAGDISLTMLKASVW